MRRLAGIFNWPIAAQVLALMVAATLVAQAVAVVAVLIAPPAPRPAYTLAEVAAALHGEAPAVERDRPLRRRVEASLPDAFERQGPRDRRLAHALAETLGMDPGQVRFVRRGPPAAVLATGGLGPRPGRPPGPRERGGPGPDGFGGPPPPWQDRLDPSRVPVGEFIAAVRLADNRWAVVEPAPEWEWVRRFAIWLVGGALLTWPLGWWFSRRVTRPIRQFADSAERLGRDPRSPPLELQGPAEIGLAARAFNDMQRRLRRYVSDRVGMMGAISHDLRTPLTRIRFKLEKASPEVRQEVLADVEQMESMIAAVLAFIRDADHDAPRERLDLGSLVACAVDDLELAGARVQMDEDTPALEVEGDPVALRRLFDNLLDNALKYGEAARVSLAAENGEAVVRIADNGPGLPPEELERVFAPFYRTHRGGEGMGLGLAIVRSVARAHGGDATLASSPAGLTAVVTLPLARN